METAEVQTYIWTINGKPRVGDLADYATDWKQGYDNEEVEVSKTVLTWNNVEDPITWDVQTVLESNTSEYFSFRIEIPSLRDRVWVHIDAAA